MLLPARHRTRSQPLLQFGQVKLAGSAIRLTSTQAQVYEALLAAVVGLSPCVVLTGATGLGKSTILAAVLASLVDPTLEIVRFDAPDLNMEQAFHKLFAPARPRINRRLTRERRVILVVDQAEAVTQGTFAYMELLTRMPGKEASIQWIIAGRPEPWSRPGRSGSDWLLDIATVIFDLPALSEQDAWGLFHHRIIGMHSTHVMTKLIAMLWKHSHGSPGRFDAMLKSVAGSGLLQGVSAQAV